MKNRLLSVSLLVVVLAYAGGALARENTKVSLMYHGGTLEEKLIKRWSAEFAAQNPGYELDWQVQPADWTTKLTVMMATGTGPDVFEGWGTPPRTWAEKGLVLDLNPYIARDYTANDLRDFFPASWEASQFQYGPKKGMRYGIPRYANVFTYYYNQDYFSESGVPFLPDLDKAGNWNWDTLLQISKKLTRTDGNKITRWALDDDSQQYPGGRGSGWIISAGGKFFDTPSNPTKFMLDQQPALAGLQFMQDLIWKHQITPPMNARGQADFTKGLAAMNLWLGTSRIGLMEQKLTFNWDLGPKPMGPASRGYYLASDMLHINAASPHPEAAWKLLKYLVSTEGQVANMQETGQGPVRRSAYPQYQAMYPKRATIYHLNSMLDSFILFLDDGSANLINKAVRDNIATNKKSPAQAIGEISAPIQALYQ